MLESRYQRGFSTERLESNFDPRIRKDDYGYYLMSLSESSKVYFNDYYRFLEMTYEKASNERERVQKCLADISEEYSESISYYRAKLVIIGQLLKYIRRYYTDGSNLGVIMTPWCFGTVILEKIETYRDRLSRGEVSDPNITDYPYYVVNYINEIYKVSLLELFDFPEQAFQMRWQYSELLKKYSKILTDISSSLSSVMTSIRNYNS